MHATDMKKGNTMEKTRPDMDTNRFQALFDNLKDAAFIETPEGKILDVNKATCALLGYTKDELVTMEVSDIVPPEIAAKLSKTIREETIEEGVYIESVSLCKDGTRVPVEVSNTLLEMEEGRMVVAILRDITERKRAEGEIRRYQEHLEELVKQRAKDLAESEERLRKIFEFTKDAMFVEKTTGEIVDVNKATCAMLGYTKEELLRMDVAAVVPPEVAVCLAKTVRKKTVQEGVYIETEDMRKDGKRVPVEVSCTLIDVKGEKRVIAILRDISERKAAERELRESEERFRKIYGNSKDAIYIEKPDGGFSDVNESACRMLGYTREELLDLRLYDVLPPEIARRMPARFIEKMPHEGVYFESKNVRKDGTVIDVEVGNSVVEIAGEKRVIAIVRDISERKKAEADLKQYREHLEDMVRARTHELEESNKELTRVIQEHEKTLEALKRSESQLKRQKTTLEQKNITLREILGHIEIEKKQIRENVAANVEELLLPSIQKLKKNAAETDRKSIDLLKKNVEEIASSFGLKISSRAHKLSPREIEICNLVRNGITSKEIAETLSVSLKTVENHRDNIRRKLKLVNKGKNLISYLQNY